MTLRISFNDTSKNAKGTAAAADVPATKTFSNDTQIGIAGTATDRRGSALVLTPGAADIVIPAGLYGGVVADGKILGDPDLIAANIPIGVTIFGIAGANNRKRWATGSVTVAEGGSLPTYSVVDESGTTLTRRCLTISGLTFTPTIIIFYFTTTTYSTHFLVYNPNIKNASYVFYYDSSDGYRIRLDGTNTYVISGGFRLSCYLFGGSDITWIAAE